MFVKGLAALNKLVEGTAQQGEDRPKATWLTLKANQTVTITFLEEIDEESGEYNPAVGTLLVATEHSNPQNFKRKALCSRDTEGECYGCQMAQAHPRTGWKGRGRLYANVLVEGDGTKDPYVAILSQGIGDKSITPALVSFANDNGSVTNIKFKLTRSGVGTATGYTIMPKIGSSGADVTKLELFDLEASCTRTVEYSKQKEYYGAFKTDEDLDAEADAAFNDSRPPTDGDASSVEW